MTRKDGNLIIPDSYELVGKDFGKCNNGGLWRATKDIAEGTKLIVNLSTGNVYRDNKETEEE